jgi:protein phosphatase
MTLTVRNNDLVLLTITTAVALKEAFRTALTGRCDARPELAAQPIPAAGGESMVVKPAANLSRGSAGLVQPGLKVRGREYLRLIYGPDYTEPGQLDRLRQRALGRKRSLALREYALGLKAPDRVARGEPLWRVHECVFAALAPQSEPVDPRL